MIKHESIEPWNMTRKEYRAAILEKNVLELVNMCEWLTAHEECVNKAITEDKPVPQHVRDELEELVAYRIRGKEKV